MMSSRFDFGLTLKTLNLSVLRFIERSRSENLGWQLEDLVVGFQNCIRDLNFFFLYYFEFFLSISNQFNFKFYSYIIFFGVFWINIAKSEVNLYYRYYSKLFGILRREIKFGYYRCRNLTKSMREKQKKVERENVEFRQR